LNVSNLSQVLPQFFQINLVRGRGLFAQTIMKAQIASPTLYTKIYSCLVAVINTKLPENGRLILLRLIAQFRRGLRMNDKIKAIGSASFIAQLINQKVAHEL